MYVSQASLTLHQQISLTGGHAQCGCCMMVPEVLPAHSMRLTVDHSHQSMAADDACSHTEEVSMLPKMLRRHLNRWSDACDTGSDSLTLDFATIVYRLQLLGFNAVRLPFSFSDLYDKQPASMQRNCAQVRDQIGAHHACYRGMCRMEPSSACHASAAGGKHALSLFNSHLPPTRERPPHHLQRESSLHFSMGAQMTAPAPQVETNVVVADTTDPSVTPSKSPPQWTTPPAR